MPRNGVLEYMISLTWCWVRVPPGGRPAGWRWEAPRRRSGGRSRPPGPTSPAPRAPPPPPAGGGATRRRRRWPRPHSQIVVCIYMDHRQHDSNYTRVHSFLALEGDQEEDAPGKQGGERRSLLQEGFLTNISLMPRNGVLEFEYGFHSLGVGCESLQEDGRPGGVGRRRVGGVEGGVARPAPPHPHRAHLRLLEGEGRHGEGGAGHAHTQDASRHGLVLC